MSDTAEAPAFQAAPPTLRLDIILCREEGLWVAHCMQLDLVAAHEDADTAYSDAKKICSEQVRYAFDGRNYNNLFRPPAPRLIDMMRRATQEGTLMVTMAKHVEKDMGIEFQRMRAA